MEHMFLFSTIAGIIAILYGFLTAKQVLKMPAGDKKMKEIAGAIQEGASAYLKRQYITISFVGIIIFIFISIFLDLNIALGFLVGALLSGVTGFIGTAGGGGGISGGFTVTLGRKKLIKLLLFLFPLVG